MTDKSIIIFLSVRKEESMTDKKKLGRPTTDPKNLKMTVRFNDEQSQKIKDYSRKSNLTMSDVIRKAVDDLK